MGAEQEQLLGASWYPLSPLETAALFLWDGEVMRTRSRWACC